MRWFVLALLLVAATAMAAPKKKAPASEPGKWLVRCSSECGKVKTSWDATWTDKSLDSLVKRLEGVCERDLRAEGCKAPVCACRGMKLESAAAPQASKKQPAKEAKRLAKKRGDDLPPPAEKLVALP